MASASFTANSFAELFDKIDEYLKMNSDKKSYTESKHPQSRYSRNGKSTNMKTEKDGIVADNRIEVPYSAPECSKLYTVENEQVDEKTGVKTTVIRVLAPLAIKESVKLTFKDIEDKTRVTLTYKNEMNKMFHGVSFSSFMIDEDVQLVFDGSEDEKFDKKNVKLNFDDGIIKICLKTLPPQADNDITVFTLG